MRIAKWSTFVLSAVTAMSLIAGCGASTENKNNTNAAEPTKEPVQDTAKEAVVNVYSARNYAVDKVLYSKFTEKTGIEVNVVDGKAEELIERLKREGESTTADLFITVDGGVLNNAKQAGILQPAVSDVINANVPADRRDADNEWIGLSTRARVIAYSKDRVKPEQLSTYEDLASESWKGKLLVRSSTSLYNQSLLSSFIELNGAEKAEQWSQGIAANLAREPEGGDRDQAKAIAAGVGDVALMNTYYVGLLLNSEDAEEVKVGNSLGVFFPNQDTTGAHINISGAGLTKHSKNQENAIKLIEYLTDVEAQSLVSSENFEYPVNPKAELPELLQSWGEFKAQTLDFGKLGEHNAKAIEIMNKTGWK
ncbi:Fe(3+) ABC transporter substrate-binding protein [Paenibacillus sp. GCM10023252]|uniref:Fe(3+) ABC transporter substrate-binding protein n=1 Tax=Paenibacillus sp. GCM10023252 TaxID=3252649 RepID=UPI00360B40EB